jgi:hypothetical protein
MASTIARPCSSMAVVASCFVGYDPVTRAPWEANSRRPPHQIRPAPPLLGLRAAGLHCEARASDGRLLAFR